MQVSIQFPPKIRQTKWSVDFLNILNENQNYLFSYIYFKKLNKIQMYMYRVKIEYFGYVCLRFFTCVSTIYFWYYMTMFKEILQKC